VFFASSWRLAGRLFTTRHLFTRDDDEVMGQIYAVRGYAGFAIIIAATMRYHGAKAVAAQENQWANTTERTVLLIAAVLGAGLILAFFWTRPSRWGALLKQFRWPLLAAGAFLAFCYAFVLLTWAVGATDHFHHRHDLPTAAMAIGYLIAVLWIIPFILRAIYLLNGGWCRAADAHPFLAPLVSTVATWIVASRALLQGIGADGTPQKVAWIITLGGPITITLLSLVEVARLKQHPGWPFRDGPLPAQTATSAHRGATRPATTSGARRSDSA